MRRITSLLLSAAVCPLLSAPIVRGQEKPKPDTRPVTVAAFKNGLGFIVEQGQIRLVNGNGTLNNVPGAVYGSLWFNVTNPGITLDEVVASEKIIDRPFPPEMTRVTKTIPELLAMNVGKTVTVTIDSKEFTGEILQIGAKKPEPGDIANPNGMIASDLLLLKSGGRVLTLKTGYVTAISFSETPVTDIPPFEKDFNRPKEKVKSFRFKVVGTQADSVNMTMGYLQKGISWSPAYLVTLNDDKTAKITMQAVLVNDATDLADTDVFFVVGVPNFTFANVFSPMALQQSLADLMGTLQRDEEALRYRRNVDSRLSNVMSQSVSAYSGSRGDSDDFTIPVNELSGSSEEDLFLYNRQHVTLAKGERATYNVFSGGIGYEDLYEWKIADSSRIDPYGNVSNPYGDQKPPAEMVWHSIRLKNSTNVPWTTAPALVLSGNKPLAQDILGYTSKGGSGTVRLTVASDINVDRNEVEISREKETVKRFDHYHDLVTVEGTLKIKNFKTKPVVVEVKKNVTGESLVLSDNGKSERVAEFIRGVNPTSRLSWEIPLKAGEEKTVTYRYKVLVR